ncbi:MAG: enoyl-CoA hydratase/isomerase family protein [Novosphingobium sp.]|nr:enoyl-CoA hydratase/isomerase family protein [Novosphingobium sp.]
MREFDVGTPHLVLEKEGPILWCRINRPQAKNAFTPAMYFGIKRAIRIVNSLEEPCALILTGTGDAFSAGGDLGGRHEPGEEQIPAGLTYEILPFIAIRESVAPVISAVNGICQGGGLLCAMMSDIAVASDRATFRVPELLRGIIDATYAAVLPAHVGMAVARDLILSCRRIDAAEAFRIGLISRMVPPEQLREAAVAAACEILRTAPEARAHTKRMLNHQYATIDYETMFVALAHGAEPREGMAAFMEKREPSWVPANLPA